MHLSRCMPAAQTAPLGMSFHGLMSSFFLRHIPRRVARMAQQGRALAVRVM